MAFVVSAGALQTIDRPTLPPAFTIALDDATTWEYSALWRAQPELRTVVDFLARNIAQLGLHVYRRVSDVDRQRLTDHELARLIERPNTNTTRYRLIDALVHDMCIFDVGYWLKLKAPTAGTMGLRRIPPGRVVPLGDSWLEPDGYEIRGTRGRLSVAAADMVCFRGYDPVDSRSGASPIESLRQILAEEYAASIWREQLWRNGARASGYLQRPVEAPPWGEAAREGFRAEWQAQYVGSTGGRAGGTPILEDGMSFVPASTSPRDAEYVASRKLTREEVARSFHIPLPMVGILDNATYSNVREQHKQLYQDCLGPWLTMLAEEIQMQLLPDMPDASGVYVEFNIQEKLRGSFEEQAAQLSSSVGAPWMTRNEARARMNLSQIDGGDELIVPLNVATALGTPGPEDPAQELARDVSAKTADVAAVLSRHFSRQAQFALSAAGRKQAPTAADLLPGRWDDELAAELLRAGVSDPLAAGPINDTTRADLAQILATIPETRAAVRALFDRYAEVRVPQLAAELTR